MSEILDLAREVEEDEDERGERVRAGVPDYRADRQLRERGVD